MDHFSSYADAGNACLAAEEQREREAARVRAALDAAWQDPQKLADACDAERVQDWLRAVRSAHDRATRDGAASSLVDAIDAALMADPMFDQWVREVGQENDEPA